RVIIGCPADVPEITMLRTDRSVVQPRRHGVRELNLPIFIRKKIRLCALQHSKPACLKTGGMFARTDPPPPGLYAHHSNVGIGEERIEKTDCVTSAANTGYQEIWQPFFLFEDLAPRLFTDHPV